MLDRVEPGSGMLAGEEDVTRREEAAVASRLRFRSNLFLVERDLGERQSGLSLLCNRLQYFEGQTLGRKLPYPHFARAVSRTPC